MNDEAPELVGTTLAGTYIIDSLLGEGGMGRVYLARHTRIDSKRFAIKVLHEEYAEHTEALERFKREAEATALITSPHVIGVHDVGKTPDGLPFIASDFLVGEELAARLERLGQFPVGEAVRIVRQVCAGLAAAHQRGVVHRDIKPENVFLVDPPEASTAKLLDFGISRLTDQNVKKLTQAGVALGTPDFMSPEQARGKTVDHRCDVYAAGVLLYVALTGVSPFERESAQESLMALLTQEAPPPTTFEAGIPAELEAIVMRAMAKEVDDRFPSALALFEALAPYDPTSGVAFTPTPSAAGSAPQVAVPHGVIPQGALPRAEPLFGALPAAPPAGVPTQGLRPTQPGEPPPDLGRAMTQLKLFGALGIGTGYLALLLGLSGAIRAAGISLSQGGQLIVAFLLVAAVGPLAALGALRLRDVTRADPTRAEQLAATTRGAVVGGCVAYGVFSMLIRFVQFVVLDAPKGLSWPLFDVLLLLATAGLAVIVGALSNNARR